MSPLIAFTSTSQRVPSKPAEDKSWCGEISHSRSTSRMNSLLFEVTGTLCLPEMAKVYPRFSKLLVICFLYLCHSTCCCSVAEEPWGHDGELDMTEIPLHFHHQYVPELRVHSIIWSLKERKETQRRSPWNLGHLALNQTDLSKWITNKRERAWLGWTNKPVLRHPAIDRSMQQGKRLEG